MHRRDALRSGAALLYGASIAGCLDALESESAWRDLVIDRPEEIYVPPKVDGMRVWARANTDGYALAISVTRPHRFWTITGTETNQISMREAHSVHLMASVWEPDTRHRIPAAVSISIDRDGERLLDRTLWPMLSQRMGVHHGDNVALPEPDTYEATVRVIPLDIKYLGAFAGGFEPASFDLEFEYDPARIEGLDRTIIEKPRRGRPGAVEPMGRGDGDYTSSADAHRAHGSHLPIPTPPPPGAFPDPVSVHRAGDYRFVVATADRETGRYLIVSPRTRYNGFSLPYSSLSATIDRDDSVPLTEATHPAFGHHYGVLIDPSVRTNLTIAAETPLQLARHEGYETAFFDLPEFNLRFPR